MPRINYLVILLLIVIFCFPAPIFAETIILKSGKSVEGKLLEKTDEYIKIDFEGIPLTYFLDEIKSIDGKPVNVAAKIPKSSGYKKDPTNIFKDISPAVVYIVSRAAGKENIGSGFILKSSGVIATNYHVVVSAEEIDIKLKDGTSYPVDSIIYYDVNRDLCILKIEATQLPFVALGNSDNLEIGGKVYCIGNPLGLEYSLSDGLLSGVRDFQGVKYLQFSAPISGGNSGGPLINAAGEIIGMNTFVYEEGQNLNFALAVNEIKPFISSVPKLTLKEFLNDRSHAEYYFLQGNKDNLQNNFEEAISNYTKAIQINPNYTEAYRNRGGTYIYIGKFNEGA